MEVEETLMTDQELKHIGLKYCSPETRAQDLTISPWMDEVRRIRAKISFEAARQETLKEVGVWLDEHAAYRAKISPSGETLPFLTPEDYRRLYDALLEGNLPRPPEEESLPVRVESKPV